jgi:hypothetical protein
MFELLTVLALVGLIVGGIYYLIGTTLVVIGAHLGGGPTWVQLGAWLVAVPTLLVLAIAIWSSGVLR